MEAVQAEPSFDPALLTDVLRRSWPHMTLTACVVFAIAVATAVLWPPEYRSTATILVEEQEIPQDLVRSTVTSYADQRIQAIGQQVMTRANLLQIVDKYKLYEKRRRTDTNEEILERLRKDVKIDLLSADVAGGRRATIAFTLAYSGESPEHTQRVANELVTLYLKENLKIRQQKAEETATFLASEAQRLEERIAEIEGRLATFKRRNMGQLPELAQLNMQLRDKAEAEVADLDRAMALMEQRRFFLQNQIAQTDPVTKTQGGDGSAKSPVERLRDLNSAYTGMRGVYSESHPDMVRARQQIQSLEEEVAATGGSPLRRSGDAALADRQKVITRLQDELTALRERYSADHPDVVSLNRRIEALRASPPAEDGSQEGPSDGNPLYLGLQTQLKVLDAELVSARARRRDIETRIGAYEARLLQTPQVEQEYFDLARERENNVLRYREMKQKQMEAQVAQELEKERKGERFSLIDPPQLPEKPRSPNRPAILMAGVLAAAVSGFAAGGLRELFDRSIKSPKHLYRAFAAPILTVVPKIETDAERKRRLRRQWSWIATGVFGLIACLALIHLFYRPLGVLWFMLLRRLDLGL